MVYTITLVPSNIEIHISQSLILASSTLSQKFTNNQELNAFKKNVTITEIEIVVSPEIFKTYLISIDNNVVDEEYFNNNVQNISDFLYISKYLNFKELTRKCSKFIKNLIIDNIEQEETVRILGYTDNYGNGLRNTLSETYFCWNEQD